MSFSKWFTSFVKTGFKNLKNPPYFDFPRRNSTFVGYTLIASNHVWDSCKVILKTGEGQKAYHNPTQMLDLAVLDENAVDISGLLLQRDAIPALCKILQSGIASMEHRLKALIILIETTEHNKKIRRYLIDCGELQKILDSLDMPCNMVAAKVMLLKHLSVEEDAFRMIWSNPKFIKEIFPCIITAHLNNLRFSQLTSAQQIALVRSQLSEVRDAFKHTLPARQTATNNKNAKTTQIEIPSVFLEDILPGLLTEMAVEASKHSEIAMTMAQNNFVDLLNNFLINTEPWYKKLFNIDHTSESLNNARVILQNISMACYKQKGWPEDVPLPPNPNQLAASNSPPSSSVTRTPAQLVAELKESRVMRKSWVLIFNEGTSSAQVVVDGKDEAVRRMIPYVNKLGLRVVPSLDVLDSEALTRAEKIMDIPVVDWEVLQEYLPSPIMRNFYSPSMWSWYDILQTFGPATLGVVYGSARSYWGMKQTYRGSHALKSTSPRWRAGVALRCGARTGLAVALMGALPEICRWITCSTQTHFGTPKDVVTAAVAERVALIGIGAYLIRNCHFWFLPFVACYVAPKQVLEELFVSIRD